jgi:predicted extracellular nuclease
MRLFDLLPLPRRGSAAAFAAVLTLAGCATRESTAPAPISLAVASPSGIVISQVYGGGGNSGATFRNDFIELFNASDTVVSLAGWSVQYASSAGTSWQITPLTGSISPGSFYLVRQAAGTGGTVDLPTPDATGSIAMSATAGKVALVNATTSLNPSSGCPRAASVQDFVGFGTAANCSETAPTATLSNTTAAIRRGAGTIDTDNNASDFVTGTPTPRNASVAVPSVASTVPTNAAVSVPAGDNLSVTFNRAVTASPDWLTLSCSVSGARPVAISGGPVTFVIDPATDLPGGETCTATVLAANIVALSDAALRMAADYTWRFTIASGDPCSNTAVTRAYDIQGSGASTPLAGQSVTTRGVVVGDYEGTTGLRGFYLQDVTGDGNPATSDAVFVFDFSNSNRVRVGDLVVVTGTAGENQGQTQVSASTITTCGTGTVAATDIVFPAASPTYLEQFEGMLVRVPQTMSVTETFQLGRFGHVTVASGGRLAQPTNVTTPGAAALALQATNDLRRLIIDDDLQTQNIDPIPFARGAQPLSASNTLRGGDAVTGVSGVLTWTWGGNAASGNAWRLRPLGSLGGTLPNFVATNARTTAPTPVGGTLKVGALNLLNYFNTFGSACTLGVSGPTAGSNGCRGANNTAEFERQAVKTVAAITGMNVDVLGIVEIENDGYGPTSAIADLVTRLNTADGAGTWAFIDADAGATQVDALGNDAIKVGLLYKPARVQPVGTTAVLNTTAFVNGGTASPLNRPAIAQAFQQPNQGRVVVSVNHFKSKGSGSGCVDLGDGQGNCNAVRVIAAQQLAAWLASDPTRTGERDVLVLGDLNAYAKEDPISALIGAGFTNLIERFNGAAAYSYGFDGQWGYLDHALASASLRSQIAGVTEWHINADEPSVLDYNTEFKTPSLVTSLFAADAFRVSDHDPIIVGLNLVPTLRPDRSNFPTPAPVPAPGTGVLSRP